MGCLPFILAGVTWLVLFFLTPENSTANWIIVLSVLIVSGMIVYTIHRRREKQRNIPRPTYPQPTATRGRSSRETRLKPTKTRIQFSEVSTRIGSDLSKTDLTGLNDAFTGEPLNAALGLYQCSNCRVYYHESSVSFLRDENYGRCAACSSTDIVPSTSTIARESGRNYEAGVVTLTNYREHIGRVVTFLGTVQRLNISRDGRHYALMFENKPWRYGFKMVVFGSNVRSMGGKNFLYNLVGKTIRIRGLLQHHDVFGYEIIATTRSMILEIRATAGGHN
jgi:hypothetical protein